VFFSKDLFPELIQQNALLFHGTSAWAVSILQAQQVSFDKKTQ